MERLGRSVTVPAPEKVVIGNAELWLGDCRDVLPLLAPVSAVVTDPPYHLTTGKKGGSGPASVNLESPYGRARIGTGFMGMEWDGGDVAFDPATWVEVLRVLKPGAYLLAFGGTRTYHRLACAIEDAGLEIRDQVGWLFGSGFPKSHNGPWGGTALKPAWEPICMARKPPIGTVEANWREHGTGALNIDGCRVGFSGPADEAESKGKNRHADFNSGPRDNAVFGADNRPRGENGNYNPPGRWPANLIHDGSDEVVTLFPQTTSVGHTPAARGRGGLSTSGHAGHDGIAERRHDAGSAARFFYCAKASKADREGSTHPTMKPTDLMRYLCRLVTPPGGIVLDPFMGSGSTGKAAILEGFRFIGIERDRQYFDIAVERISRAQAQGKLLMPDDPGQIAQVGLL